MAEVKEASKTELVLKVLEDRNKPEDAITAALIAAAAGVPHSSVGYHLDMIKAQGYIISHTDKKPWQYWISGKGEPKPTPKQKQRAARKAQAAAKPEPTPEAAATKATNGKSDTTASATFTDANNPIGELTIRTPHHEMAPGLLPIVGEGVLLEAQKEQPEVTIFREALELAKEHGTASVDLTAGNMHVELRIARIH